MELNWVLKSKQMFFQLCYIFIVDLQKLNFMENNILYGHYVKEKSKWGRYFYR